MTSATPTVAETPRSTPPNKRRRKLFNLSEGGGAPLLVAPTLILLAVVIGYPVIKAVFMSFQKDPGLDKATGLFVSGGFAGFSNYTHWLFQQCDVPGGGRTSCPAGSLGARSRSTRSTASVVRIVSANGSLLTCTYTAG